MAIYIELINWTEQGIKNLKDSPARLDQARALGKKLGVEIKDFYMTSGQYDMLVIADAKDAESMAKFNLTLAMGGNVRTTTLAAYGEDAYRRVIAGL